MYKAAHYLKLFVKHTMIQALFEDRVAFFRAQSASVAFAMARDAVSYIVNHNLNRNHPLHDCLVTSFVVHYA
jgi:hypothetical protein